MSGFHPRPGGFLYTESVYPTAEQRKIERMLMQHLRDQAARSFDRMLDDMFQRTPCTC